MLNWVMKRLGTVTEAELHRSRFVRAFVAQSELLVAHAQVLYSEVIKFDRSATQNTVFTGTKSPDISWSGTLWWPCSSAGELSSVCPDLSCTAGRVGNLDLRFIMAKATAAQELHWLWKAC